MKFLFIVTCKDDDAEGGFPGAIQATRRVWSDEQQAYAYARTIAPSRNPMVIMVHDPSQWRIDQTEPG